MTETLILQHDEIMQKIKRLAWEVYENNFSYNELVVIGIKERGKVVADLLCGALKEVSQLKIHQAYIELNADAPQDSIIENLVVNMQGMRVVLVDDVLNSGKTLMAATVPILLQKPHSLQTVVLADRDHKRFAIATDYVGISLATTLQEHISFSKNKEGKYSVSLR